MRRETVASLLEVLLEWHSGEPERRTPSKAKAHFRAMRREALYGLRAVIDAALAEEGEEAGAKPNRSAVRRARASHRAKSSPPASGKIDITD
ncbi:hypothetical protein ACFQZE_13625 [Paenibacillus sp. GCM10027627]|uniref:hypothetical protein n=1 Tax=unclassified Paenibacillus TaxID=185978 RepID=UPI0036409A26